MNRGSRPVAVDLFCGAGGMSLGFEQAGFDVIAAVDSDPVHASTYAANFPMSSVLCKDISVLSGEQVRADTGLEDRQIDVVFGGPPCQGFSLIGRRRSDDPRNQLLLHFARLVTELRPKYFVVENVHGLLTSRMQSILGDFLRRVDGAGYSVVSPIRVLDASHYGVPQARRRVFIAGSRVTLSSFSYPSPACGDNGPRKPPTVWDAIGDLPKVDEIEELLRDDEYHGQLGVADNDYARILRGEIADPDDHSARPASAHNTLSGCRRTVHCARTVQRFAVTEPAAYEPVSRFYRLSRDGLCPTLRAGSGRNHGSFTAPRPIHPLQPRCITVREGARLHSFPDWFRFHPTKWHGFRQVGNAVPPLLARAIASAVRRALETEV